MRASKPITITLPQEMARAVKDRVDSGAYASESEVIRDGLRALAAQEDAREHWLRTEGVARYEAYKVGKTKPVPIDEAFAQVRKHIAKRKRKG